MQGSSLVVDFLNTLLRGELAARDQYFVHSRRYAHLGLSALHQRMDHEMQEETQHADALLQRILLLQGEPDMRPMPFTAGVDVVDMLNRDLATEYLVRGELTTGMQLCEQQGDFVTRDILLSQLRDTEEDHTRWLEQQLRLIKLMGLDHYIQAQSAAP